MYSVKLSIISTNGHLFVGSQMLIIFRTRTTTTNNEYVEIIAVVAIIFKFLIYKMINYIT